jgi:serine kinase of HPr protein (carbohydrate metabolism regulator)
MSAAPVFHAGLVGLRLGGLWRGALIQGPSGAGKSDLALRCLADGFRLVADDRVLVFVSGGRLFGTAPASLRGLVEARGLGVIPSASVAFAEIVLAIDCANDPAKIERLPDREFTAILGVSVPRLPLWPLEGSGPAKLRRALEHLGAHRQQAYLAALRLGASPERRGVGR